MEYKTETLVLVVSRAIPNTSKISTQLVVCLCHILLETTSIIIYKINK